MGGPELAGIHHLKMAVSDVAQSRAWYQQALGFTALQEFRDDDGVVRGVAGTIPSIGTTMLALRENPELAAASRGFDPIAFAVADQQGLAAWSDYLDERQIPHTPITPATMGNLIALDDPDGTHILLYANADRTNE